MGTSKIMIDGVGIDLSSDTVTSSSMLQGNTAHNSSGDIISGNIDSLSATTYVPGTTDQIIYAGKYLSGNQRIKGDANLVPAYIKSGKTIFNVTGTCGPYMYYRRVTFSDLANSQYITINFATSSSSYPPTTATQASLNLWSEFFSGAGGSTVIQGAIFEDATLSTMERFTYFLADPNYTWTSNIRLSNDEETNELFICGYCTKFKEDTKGNYDFSYDGCEMRTNNFKIDVVDIL